MAAIAASDITAGSAAFHKPQGKEAGKADASSPFQQLLDALDAGQVQGDQGTEDAPDAGKTAPTDLRSAPTADQILAATNDNDAADAPAAQDVGKTSADQNSAATNEKKPDGALNQSTDSPAPQPTLDPSQILAAAQIVLPPQAGNTNTRDARAGDTPGSELGAPEDTKAADASLSKPADPAASKAGSGVPSGKVKDAQGSTVADSLPADEVPPQGDTPAPSSAKSGPGKDTKSGKAQDATPSNSNDNTDKSTAGQAPVAAPLVVAAVAPPPPSPPAAPSAQATLETAPVGDAKDATKNSKANIPAASDLGNRWSGDAAKPNSADGKPPVPNAQAGIAQSGTGTAQGSDGTKNDSAKADAAPQATASTNDKQVVTPPAQSQPPQQPAPPQPQAAIAAVQPALQPQTHIGAASDVTQNVQVGPQDASTGANTVGALAVAIAAKSQSGTKQFDIRLDPPELGRVEVRLSIDSTGKAQASLSADQPRTLDLLKTDAPTLTRALRDAGLNVAQNGLNFSLRGQDRQNGNNGGFAPRSGRGPRMTLTAISAIGPASSGANYQGPANGRLDIRV